MRNNAATSVTCMRNDETSPAREMIKILLASAPHHWFNFRNYGNKFLQLKNAKSGIKISQKDY
jgi:hypothetical protein